MKHRIGPAVAALATLTLWTALSACGTGGRDASGYGAVRAPEDYGIFVRSDLSPHVTRLSAPPERVWEVLPAVFRESGYPGDVTGDRVFTTSNLRIRGRLYEGERNSQYINCGMGVAGSRADHYEVQFHMVSRVRERDDGGTILETVLIGEARDRTVSGGGVHCTGTGKLEGALAALVRRRLR